MYKYIYIETSSYIFYLKILSGNEPHPGPQPGEVELPFASGTAHSPHPGGHIAGKQSVKVSKDVQNPNKEPETETPP